MAKGARAVKPATSPTPEPTPAPMIVTKAGIVRKATNRKTAGRDKGETKRGKAPGGRPSYTPTEEQKGLVSLMIAGGIEHRFIAAALGISKPTLEKHFRYEIDNAAAQANAKVIASLFKEANAGNIRAQEFWLTNRASGRWAYKQKLDAAVDLNVNLGDRIARARKRLKGGKDD